MANNQDNDKAQDGSHQANPGDAGGRGSQGGMADTQHGGQQSGHKPDDKMDKDWEKSRDTGHQGGQMGGKDDAAETGRMGGQTTQDTSHQKDPDR